MPGISYVKCNETTDMWKMCYTNKFGLAYFSHLAHIQMCAFCISFTVYISCSTFQIQKCNKYSEKQKTSIRNE